MSLFLFWLVIVTGAPNFVGAGAITTVNVDAHSRLSVFSSDVNIVPTVNKVIVCSSAASEENAGAVAKTLPDSVKKCETNGFIQYEIVTTKSNRIYHPHMSRVTGDHYFAQVHVKLYNTVTGAVTEEIQVVRVDVLRQDIISVTLGCMTLAIVCIFAVVAVARHKKQRPLFNKQSMDTLAADIGLYSSIKL
jgi:hypothetical protein